MSKGRTRKEGREAEELGQNRTPASSRPVTDPLPGFPLFVELLPELRDVVRQQMSRLARGLFAYTTKENLAIGQQDGDIVHCRKMLRLAAADGDIPLFQAIQREFRSASSSIPNSSPPFSPLLE